MRWSRVLRWVAFVVFVAAAGGYQVYAVFVEEPDRSGHLPPAKDVHPSREILGNCGLTQTFVVHADGFSAIEVYPRRGSSPPQGTIRVRILDGRGQEFQPLVVKSFDNATLDLNGALRIPVPRVDHSSGGLFMLEVLSNAPALGHGGITFEQGGPTYPEGLLSIGCQQDWGDLKFRIEVQRPTIFSSIQHERRSLPGPLASDAALLALWLIGNAALAVVVYALAFASDRAPGRSSDQSPPKGRAETTAVQPRV